jgi:peptide/nickel transport system permease protein
MGTKKTPAMGMKQSQWADVWYRLRQNKTAMIGLIVILIIFFFAIFAGLIANYDTQVLEQHAEARLQTPSLAHPFGTDQFGRDLFARIIHGARYSLSFGIICTFISLVGGGILGATSAFFGGKVDNWIMRAMDALMCIPGILLALALVAALGPGLTNMMIAISISSIPGYARIVRSAVLTVVRMEYIEAAKACGVGPIRTIMLHVLPNAIGTITVNATMSIAGLILAAAGLSYIGMGIQPPAPEWGAMLSESTTYMRLYPHLVIFPGLAILITALSFNLLGDGLTEALDPRMRE